MHPGGGPRNRTRKIVGRPELADVFALPLSLARRVKDQRQRQRGRKLSRCMLLRSSALAKARPTNPMSSACEARRATPQPLQGRPGLARVKALPATLCSRAHAARSRPADIESTIGAGLERIVTDAGYKGHDITKTPARSRSTWQVRSEGSPPAIKRAFRRRSAVEPTIGHLKNEHRMGRDHLAGRAGDAANAVLAAVGYNSASSSGGSLSCCASSWLSSSAAARTGPS